AMRTVARAPVPAQVATRGRVREPADAVLTPRVELIIYGETFFVETPNATSIAQVTWVGLSSVTHAFNMNQRINVIGFSQTAGGLNVVSPSSPTLAPVGHYMLFILNSDG